jgi:hypothetical protein
MMKGLRLVLAAALVAATLAAPRVARAEGEYGNEAGWGILSVLVNVGYMPAKVVYGTMGGLTGGLAYICTGGSYETASSIWTPSLGGTYAVTPSMLRGEEPIQFAGSSTSGVTSEATPVDEVQPRHGRAEESLPAS